jgi:tRNA(Ile2) C34 agmatinyltransferase TiaS
MTEKIKPKSEQRNARAEALKELRVYAQEDDIDYLARQWSKETGLCYYCKTKLRTTSVGKDGWETSCPECDYLYDED